MIDAGRGVEPGEFRRLLLAERALDVFEVADPRIGALGVVGHVLENHELAAARAEAAEVGVGRIHQLRYLKHALLVIFRPVLRDVELRVAREDVLNAARAVDPGDAVGRRGGCVGAALPSHQEFQPPVGPKAGSVFARDAPARIIIKAVFQREREFVGRMQRLDRGDLGIGQALIAALARRAAQRLRLEFRLAADRILNGAESSEPSALSQACRTAFATSSTCAGRIQPSPMVDQARPRPGMLQADPVDDGHACEDAVEVVRVTLRHRQALAAAFRRSHEIQFGRRIAVGAHHQGNGGVAHPLVGAMRKILEGFVVERKELRRFARLGLMAGIGAIGDEAPRQRRRRPNGKAGGRPRPVISTPLKPPPPYCSERPFHSTGRFTWKLIGGALGSDGAIWPSTLQNSGLAGVTRAAGVGPLSATASGVGANDGGGFDPDGIVGRSDKVAAGRAPDRRPSSPPLPRRHRMRSSATSEAKLSPRAHDRS